jgi:hypothetical protein
MIETAMPKNIGDRRFAALASRSRDGRALCESDDMTIRRVDDVVVIASARVPLVG